MGRRRRRQRRRILRPKKTIPKVFLCPHCARVAVNVRKVKEKGQEKVIVVCGVCGLRAEYEVNELYQPVDYYNKFVDDYYDGKIEPPAESAKAEETKTEEQEVVEEGAETEEGSEGE